MPNDIVAEEIARLDAENVTDQKERDRRIAAAVQASKTGTTITAQRPELELGEGMGVTPSPYPPMSRGEETYRERTAAMKAMGFAVPEYEKLSIREKKQREAVKKRRMETEYEAYKRGETIDEETLQRRIALKDIADPLTLEPGLGPSGLPPEAENAPSLLTQQPQAPVQRGLGGGLLSGMKPIWQEERDLLEREKTKGAEAIEDQRTQLYAEEQYAMDEANAAVRIHKKRQDALQIMQTDEDTREQERITFAKDRMDKVYTALDTMKQAKVDPTRFYKHADGSANYGKNISAIIAVGLGALGSSLPASMGGRGGPNAALAILDKAIDRDIAAQQADIANQRAGVGLEMNMLSHMRGVLGDERSAFAATKRGMLESYEMQLKTTAAGFAPGKVALNAQRMLDGLQVMKDKQDIDIDKRSIALKTREQGVREQVRRQQTAARASQEAAMAPGTPIGGFTPFRKVEKDERQKWQEVSIAYTNAIKYVGRLIELGETSGREAFGKALSDVSKEAGELISEATIALNVVARLGALSGHDLPLLQEPLPNPTDVWQTTHLASLKRKLARLSGTQTDTAKHYGYGPQGNVQGEGAAQ